MVNVKGRYKAHVNDLLNSSCHAFLNAFFQAI